MRIFRYHYNNRCRQNVGSVLPPTTNRTLKTSYTEDTLMLRGHKITLRPTARQRRWFAMQCGYARVAYNDALHDWNHGAELGDLRKRYKLSRKEYESNNWHKQKLKVERIHYRISCIREDAHHQATTAIVRNASKIGIETLRVTNMVKNRKLAKALSYSALGGFLAMLKSKADALGIAIVEAPQFFASSKTCSNCGHKKEDLTLADRMYHCESCGYTVDRDINAAINLRTIAVGETEM